MVHLKNIESPDFYVFRMTKDHFGQVKVPGTAPYYSTTNVSNKVKAGKLLKV
jgi:hypothetical protein